jgi:hypothetical protein
MTEIAQLFESALRSNRSTLLRNAAIKTVVRMSPDTTLRDLLESEAREAIRELTLDDLAQALREKRGRRPRLTPRASDVGGDGDATPRSDEEQLYRRILEVLTQEPLTIGQLAKRMGMDTTQLRGYVNWMKRMGKLRSSGRARSTRYFAPT